MKSTFSSVAFLKYLADTLVQAFAHAGAATTPGLVGSARETEVRRKLEMLLPSKVAVATGCVIDSFGSTSNQADVVIHEKDNCPVFSISNTPEATYFPCESVVAVGEIKSVLGTKELNDSVAKLRNVKALRRAMRDQTCFRLYGQSFVAQGAPQESIDPVRKYWDQTYGFVLCQSFGVALETLAKNYAAACSEAAPELAPSIVVSLNDGVMMFANENGALLRNAVGAKRLAFFRHPAGEFQYLLSEIVHICQKGRTTDVYPHSLYLLGEHINASVEASYVQIA